MRNRHLLGAGAIVLALVCVAAPAMAAPQLANVSAAPSGIEWQPAVDGVGLVLTVSGPDGFYLRQDAPPGAGISFGVFDGAGDFRPSGSYVWELTAVVTAPDAPGRDAGGDSPAASLQKAGKLPAGPLVQSGHFAIEGGAIVTGGEQEARPARPEGNRIGAKDQVIADDLIVQGSTCVGFDCVNGESFGFDTIRLKENNLRIKFQDTSSSASFPTNDWQLTANDSSNGGANKFSIEDITGARVPFTIRAGAPSNSLFVDSSGRLGFGTSTPVLNLHVVTGNTPALRLEQNSSSGFAAQTWDIAGNETNFFIRDVTNGSRLPFRIRPGAPTSSIDVAASGKVGIGTASPAERMHVFENADVNTLLMVENTNTGLSVAGVLRAKSDTATVNFQAHGSGRTISRFGETLADWSELLQVAGDGLIIGTLGADPLILGTNSNNVLEITSAGDVLYQGVAVHSDYVFDPNYELPSIEEQEEYMWSKKHLPAIGPARFSEDGREVMALGSDRQAIVEELEKAHIYIGQLNRELQQKASAMRTLEERLQQLEEVVAADD